MSTYRQCGEMYRLKYIERIPEDPAVWSIGGTAFHSLAEQLLRGHGSADWAEAWFEALHDTVKRHEERAGVPAPPTNKWRRGNRGREGVAWWHEQLPQMVARFEQWWANQAAGLNVLELAGQPALELRIETELGGVPIVAIPDALVVDEHGQLDVLDYKSGRNAPKDALQLSVYRAAVYQHTGLLASWGLYYMSRAGEVIPWDLTKGPSPEQIGDMFADFDTRETAGDYAPNPGKHCSYCGVRDHCIYKERR